jgi:hypothetical protein
MGQSFMQDSGSFVRYSISAPDVVTEDFDGQVVVLNLANGHYFSLEGIASAIWARILDGYALEAIGTSLRASRPELVEDADAFLAKVRELGLIRIDEATAPETAAIVQDWSGEAPRLIVYEDLAELIYADPIHDVDEQAGWPIRKAGE